MDTHVNIYLLSKSKLKRLVQTEYAMKQLNSKLINLIVESVVLHWRIMGCHRVSNDDMT